jgi:hypothetical protein
MLRLACLKTIRFMNAISLSLKATEIVPTDSSLTCA